MLNSIAQTQDDVEAGLSLYQLLDPEVLANPYPLFHQHSRRPIRSIGMCFCTPGW